MYNCTSGSTNPLTWRQLQPLGLKSFGWVFSIFASKSLAPFPGGFPLRASTGILTPSTGRTTYPTELHRLAIYEYIQYKNLLSMYNSLGLITNSKTVFFPITEEPKIWCKIVSQVSFRRCCCTQYPPNWWIWRPWQLGASPNLSGQPSQSLFGKMQINKYKDKDNIQLVRSTFVANECALIFQMTGLSRKCTDRKKSSISSRKHIVIF